MKFNWANSHGGFKNLVGLDCEKTWVDQCNKLLDDLKKLKDAEKDDDESIIDGTIVTGKDIPGADIAKEIPEAEALNTVGKRKVTDELINQLTVPSKRKPKQEATQESDLQKKVDNCRIGIVS